MHSEQEAHYEILETGRIGDNADHGYVEEIAPLDLGIASSSAVPERTELRAWQRWAALAAAGAFGAVLGGYLAYIHSLTPSVSDVVVSGFASPDQFNGVAEIQMELANVGRNPVTLRSFAIPDWSASRDSRLVLDAGERRTVPPLRVDDPCNRSTPTALIVDVEDGSGTRTGKLALPSPDIWADLLATMCEQMTPRVSVYSAALFRPDVEAHDSARPARQPRPRRSCGRGGHRRLDAG